MRAEVHLHISRFRKGLHDCISVRNLPNYQVEYFGTVALKDVSFAVQPAGLRKFRDTGQKNVHAFVRGEIVSALGGQIAPTHKGQWREAYYNPNVTDTFVDRQTGNPLHSADAAYLVGNKVYYLMGGRK